MYPDVKPVQHKLRRIPLSVRDAVSKELQKLQDADIIEPVNEASEWISPTVVAFKSSGDYTSLCRPTYCKQSCYC